MMAMASPAICGGDLLLESAAYGQSSDGGAIANASSRHPRLFYNRASLDRMRQMLASNTVANAGLKKRGEELLEVELIPENVAERGGGQHANYGEPGNQVAEMGMMLGLLYHMSGDKRYAEKLRGAMLHYAQYVRWAGQGLADRVPPWHSELNTAKFSFGYSTGYDALHDMLSPDDRKTIADAMVRLAIFPTLNDWVLAGRRIHSFDSMGHNWWGVCVAGAGLCSLALFGDDPRAQEWIDAVDAGFEQWFRYPGNVLQNRMPPFERSGPSYEGVNYTHYGVSEYLHYRFAWQNTYPDKKPAHMEPLDQVASFFLQTLYPTSTGFYSVNFDDTTIEVDATATMLLLIACGLGTPDASRYLEYVNTHAKDDVLLSLLRQHPQPPMHGEMSTSCIYPHMGWAMMRTSWEKDATLLAMKSGYTWNHAHPDAGSFVLFKQGEPLIIDSGTCLYNRPEYTTYYRQSRAHNVILFDGSGQPDEDVGYGCKFPGQMHCLIDGHGLKYAYGDATGPMARWFTRNYRHWLWSGDVIFIIDDVRAHTSGRMDWLLHYAGDCTFDQGGVRIKNGAAEAVVRILYPPCEHREDMGLADHDPDQKVPYLVFYPNAAERSRQFITAICLNPEEMPKIEVLEDPNYVGARLVTKDAVEELYLNLRAINSVGSIGIKIGDWETDAYMLHFRRPTSRDAVERYFISDGSYLRCKGQSVIESLSKLTACWSQSDSLEVQSDDSSESIRISTDNLPRSVRWNGRSVAIQYDKHKKLVLLRRSL